MGTYGNVAEFRESVESWTQYAEGLHQYFKGNVIADGKKQREILLSPCGLIRDLVQPKKPSESDV